MRERVRQFGGELNVNPAEPGTLLEAKIPLFNLNFIPGYRARDGIEVMQFIHDRKYIAVVAAGRVTSYLKRTS